MKKILFITTCLLLTMAGDNSYAAAGAMEELEKAPTSVRTSSYYRRLAAKTVEEEDLVGFDKCLTGIPEKRKVAIWRATLRDLETDPKGFHNYAIAHVFTKLGDESLPSSTMEMTDAEFDASLTYNPIEMTDAEFDARLKSAELVCYCANIAGATNFLKINPLDVFISLFEHKTKSPEEIEETVRFFVQEVSPRIGGRYFYIFGRRNLAAVEFEKYDRLGREAYLAQLKNAIEDIV